ncbi:MAG: hypothetical protein ACTSWQ_04265 [Candidatus Thorarchaeota archaeon]
MIATKKKVPKASGGISKERKQVLKKREKASEDPKIREINMSRKIVNCPRCGTGSKRNNEGERNTREVGISMSTVLRITYSKHYCPKCRKYFSNPMDHIVSPSARFTNMVRRTAVDLVSKEQLTLEKACDVMWNKYHVHIPTTTLHDWVVAKMYSNNKKGDTHSKKMC